jgi:hypothetical protein
LLKISKHFRQIAINLVWENQLNENGHLLDSNIESVSVWKDTSDTLFVLAIDEANALKKLAENSPSVSCRFQHVVDNSKLLDVVD